LKRFFCFSSIGFGIKTGRTLSFSTLLHVGGSEFVLVEDVAEGKGDAFGLGTTEGDISEDVSEIVVVCDSLFSIVDVDVDVFVDVDVVACCLSGFMALGDEEIVFSFFSMGLTER